MIEVIVHYEGSKSSITFDALPTFNTLRRAITSDITNGDSNFIVIGATQRGTPLSITDQTSFVRALGPRTSMVLTVRPQAAVAAAAGTTTTTTTPNMTPIQHHHSAAATPTPLRSSNTNTSMMMMTKPPLAVSSSSFSDPNQSPPRSGAPPPPSTSSSSSSADSLGTVQQIVNVAGDTRCCIFVPLPAPTVWAGERQTGNVRIHDYYTGAVRSVLRYEDGSAIAATSQVLRAPAGSGVGGPQSGCLCLAFVPAFNSGSGGAPDCVWAGFNSKEIRVFNTSGHDHKRMLRGILSEHSAAVTAIEPGPSSADSSNNSRSPYCFSASLDFSILQWNVDSMSVARVFSRHRNAVRSLTTTGGGSGLPFLFSGGDDRSLVAWDARSGEIVAEGVHIHGGGIHALAVDSESRVWTGCEDGSVKVWQLQKTMEPETNNGLRFRFQCTASFREHAAAVSFIRCFRARAVSSSHDGTICVYDAAALQPMGAMPHPHDAPAVSVALASFSTVFKFWTGSSDRKLCRWTLEDPGGVPDAAVSAGAATALQQFGQQNNNNHGNSNASSSAQDDAISLLRFTLDRTTEKTLIVAEEAKNRAELMHMFERRLRQKYYVPHTEGLRRFSDAAAASHAEYGKLLVDAHVSTCLESRSALERSHSTLAVAQAELDTVQRQRDNQGRKATDDMHSASASISALNKRMSELESALAFARAEVARATTESRERADREAEMKQAYDQAVSRQKTLEADAKKAHEARHQEVQGRDKGLTLRDEQWRQKEFVLQEEIASQRSRLEERDAQLRTLRLQLASQQSLAASKEAELSALARAAAEGGASGSAAAAKERELWAERSRSLEEKLDKALAENNAVVAKTAMESSALKTQLGQREDELRSLRADADAEQRASSARIAELESAVATLSESSDAARAQWQQETETLSRDLTRTNDTLNRADGYAVKVERDAALERATLKHLETQSVQMASDNSRLREALLVERSSAQAQNDALENTIATLRREHAEAQNSCAAEQQARLAVERRLASIERSYEELKRTVDDGASAVSTAYDMDTSALARKYNELEAAANSSTAQLQDDVESLQAQLAAAQRLKTEAETDAVAKANEANALATELREARSTLSNEQSARRRESESLRLDIADLTHAAATATARQEQEARNHEEEMADVKGRLQEATASRRKLEADLARASSEAAAAHAKAAVLSEAEGQLHEERAQLVRDLTELQAAVTAAETRSALTSKRLLEADAAVAATHDEKTRLLAAKQQLLEQMEQELDAARDMLHKSESKSRALEATIAEVETEARTREAKQAQHSDEASRSQSEAVHAAEQERHLALQQVASLSDRLREAEAEARRASDAARAAQDQVRQMAVERDAREQELSAAVAQAEQRCSALAKQVDTADSAAREWRDIATKVQADADAQLDNAIEEHNLRTNDRSSVAQLKIERLEAAVGKAQEMEQILQERSEVLQLDAERAREQLALVQREVGSLRDEARAANAAAQRHKADADDLRQELRSSRSSVSVAPTQQQQQQPQQQLIAVRRLEAENEDLRSRVQTLLRSGGGPVFGAAAADSSSSTTSAARFKQLEDENDVLHGRVASLDAERNAAWKELQQLLDDHRVLHKQFNELKMMKQASNGSSSSNNNAGLNTATPARPQQHSSEIAALRQQHHESLSRRAVVPTDLSSGQSTRGAALAAHYSEMLHGVRDALSLVQQRTGGHIDSMGAEQLRNWLSSANVRGEAVVSALFTDEERRQMR